MPLYGNIYRITTLTCVAYRGIQMNANEGTLTELYAFSMAISCLIYKGIYMTIGIYKITCKENGKHYIGQSIDIERRIYDHFHKYRSSQTRSKISKAIYVKKMANTVKRKSINYMKM